MKALRSILTKSVIYYFALTGIAVHLLAFATYIYQPTLASRVIDKARQYLSDRGYPVGSEQYLKGSQDPSEDVTSAIGNWEFLQNETSFQGRARIGDRIFPSISEAVSSLNDGDTLEIGVGIHKESIVIENNNITVRGIGRSVIEGVAAKGKAAILNKGDNNRIENIECRFITVKDKNGACIRHQGKNLVLVHVYFHHSESGLLSGRHPGEVVIRNSRFEQLGKSGRAHGVYMNGGTLIIDRSLFVASLDQGHEIKTRGERTVIKNSVIASLSGNDSRLIDVCAGGQLVIENSILQQGPNSVNQDAIGFGLEGYKHANNSIVLKDNLVLLERNLSNNFINIKGSDVKPVLHGNTFVSKEHIDIEGFNLSFANRAEAGLPDYPELPLSRIGL
ncbi:MAG: hypothetical protein ABW090_01770 [Sedimenticola sp.]